MSLLHAALSPGAGVVGGRTADRPASPHTHGSRVGPPTGGCTVSGVGEARALAEGESPVVSGRHKISRWLARTRHSPSNRPDPVVKTAGVTRRMEGPPRV